MRKMLFLPRLPLLLLLVAGAVFLTSCATYSYNPVPGSNAAQATKHLAVSDSYNRRVLIFDAPFVTGESASIVLGQPDMSSYTFQSANPQKRLEGPAGLSIDAAGNLYVADVNDDRVAQFQPPFTTFMDASLEMGVPGFDSSPDVNTSTCYHDPPSMSLCMPAGAVVDKDGNLWVADLWEGRVVEYQPPFQTAMNASVELGQPDMSHTANCDGVYTIFRNDTGAPMTTTASIFCMPSATAMDPQGDVWVVDAGNDRILEFTPPFSSGMAANLEIGFPVSVGMSSPTPFADAWKCPSNGYLCGPGALAFDAAGNLWVADSGNNRVLQFIPPFSNGMAPSLVIGQPDFVQVGANAPAPNTLNNPASLTLESNGDLVVADRGNSRVVIFAPPFRTGMNASVVIGQPNFKSNTSHACGGGFGTADAATFCGPDGVLAF